MVKEVTRMKIIFFPFLPIKNKKKTKNRVQGTGERIKKNMSCLWATAKNSLKGGIL